MATIPGSLIEAACHVAHEPDPWRKAQLTLQYYKDYHSGALSRIYPDDIQLVKVLDRPRRSNVVGHAMTVVVHQCA